MGVMRELHTDGLTLARTAAADMQALTWGEAMGVREFKSRFDEIQEDCHEMQDELVMQLIITKLKPSLRTAYRCNNRHPAL